jgi:hypothetical protein
MDIFYYDRLAFPFHHEIGGFLAATLGGNAHNPKAICLRCLAVTSVRHRPQASASVRWQLVCMNKSNLSNQIESLQEWRDPPCKGRP